MASLGSSGMKPNFTRRVSVFALMKTFFGLYCSLEDVWIFRLIFRYGWTSFSLLKTAKRPFLYLKMRVWQRPFPDVGESITLSSDLFFPALDWSGSPPPPLPPLPFPPFPTYSPSTHNSHCRRTQHVTKRWVTELPPPISFVLPFTVRSEAPKYFCPRAQARDPSLTFVSPPPS